MKKRILVIDDEPRFADAIRSFLEQNGYEVLGARDGVSGFDITRREKPDLVLSDVLLPKLSGFLLCQKIKEDPALAAIPVVLMTAVYKKTKYKLDAKQYGADDYLIKPFEFQDLLQKVQGRLGKAEKPAGGQEALLDKLKELGNTYASELPGKIRRIDGLITRTAGQWDAESIATAQRMSHGIAGSGSLFGFHAVSKAARDLELVLQTFLEASSPPDDAGRKTVSELVERLKAAAVSPGNATV